MRYCALPLAAFLLSILALGGLWGDTAEKDETTKKIEALVQQLGDEDFAKRDAASKDLDTLGDKALALLRKAATGDDAEVRWRAQLLLAAPRRKSTSIGLELVLIKSGDFRMGSPENEASRNPDEPWHPVSITKPFYLGVYEVTQDEFQQVMKFNPSSFTAKGKKTAQVPGVETARFPVEGVTWFDALEFCNRLGKQDSFEPYYKLEDVKLEGDSIKSAKVTVLGGYGYRLPTEAEWEFACRAGTQNAYHFGASSNGVLANTRGVVISAGGYGGDIKGPNLGRTSRVGSYAANSWGLFDMHGNAGEWCWDYYSKDYYAGSPRNDPRGPETGNQRVIRGGSWLTTEVNARAASRFWQTPDEAKDFVGFRVARNP
ncbi:MAG: SUMF1/EgtB/PvdO family nonheme iron enzyme [Pirellulaceae bacterium]